jgi:hypothetical protein
MIYVGFSWYVGVCVFGGKICEAHCVAKAGEWYVMGSLVFMCWCGLEISAHEYDRVFVVLYYVLLDPLEDGEVYKFLFVCVELLHI